MDNTIRELLEMAEEEYKTIETYAILIKPPDLEAKINKLQTIIKHLQSTAKRIADISNSMNQLLLYKTNNKERKNIIDPYPTPTRHSLLRAEYPLSESSIKINERLPPVTIKKVNSIGEIPISPLYYIAPIDTFAININGIVIKGTPSNIVPYGTGKSALCQYGLECNSLKKRKENPKCDCKYFHPTEDYIKMNTIPPRPNTRNFTVGSYIYTKNKAAKTGFMRHVGSIDTIAEDIFKLRQIQYKEEINNREGQLIHDLLIYMLLHHTGYVES
jgi:hypothetical protein